MKTVNHTQHTKWVGVAVVLIFLMHLFSAKVSAQNTAIINTGVAGAPAYNAGPIYRSGATSAYDASRYCYLYTASELAAAGITPWSIINSVGWAKSNNAVSNGPAIFRIYMRNTQAADFSATTATWASLNAGTTLVYENLAQNIDSFVAPTYLEFPLDSPFLYNGGSLEISTEWDINSVSGSATTGTFSWLWSTVVDRVYGKGNTTLAPITSLSATTNSISTIDDRRPFIKIDYTPGVTGMESKSAEQDLRLFPNPATSKVLLTYTGKDEINRIKLLSTNGEEIQTIGIVEKRSNQEMVLDVSGLSKGIYILQVLSKDKLISKKLVVQ